MSQTMNAGLPASTDGRTVLAVLAESAVPMSARVKFRLWLSKLTSAESDAITDSYAWPPRAPLSVAEHATVTDLFELGERAYDDALAIAGVNRDDDAAGDLWREAKEAM